MWACGWSGCLVQHVVVAVAVGGVGAVEGSAAAARAITWLGGSSCFRQSGAVLDLSQRVMWQAGASKLAR